MINSNSNSENLAGIDKDALYGDFRERQNRENKLYLRAAHKSLDIPYDDMGDIGSNNTTTNSGVGTLGVAGIALASGGLPVAALWLAGLFDKPEIPTKPEPAPVVKPDAKPETVEKIIKDDWNVEEPYFGKPQ